MYYTGQDKIPVDLFTRALYNALSVANNNHQAEWTLTDIYLATLYREAINMVEIVLMQLKELGNTQESFLPSTDAITSKNNSLRMQLDKASLTNSSNVPHYLVGEMKHLKPNSRTGSEVSSIKGMSEKKNEGSERECHEDSQRKNYMESRRDNTDGIRKESTEARRKDDVNGSRRDSNIIRRDSYDSVRDSNINRRDSYDRIRTEYTITSRKESTGENRSKNTEDNKRESIHGSREGDNKERESVAGSDRSIQGSRASSVQGNEVYGRHCNKAESFLIVHKEQQPFETDSSLGLHTKWNKELENSFVNMDTEGKLAQKLLEDENKLNTLSYMTQSEGFEWVVKEFQIGQGINIIDVEFVCGNIACQSTDAIVNAANDRLAPGAGTTGSIFHAGGKQMEEYCKSFIQSNGNLKVNYFVTHNNYYFISCLFHFFYFFLFTNFVF